MSEYTSPRISVHGDDISTFAGYTDNNLSYYSERTAKTAGFGTAEGTWWMQVTKMMGGSFVGNGASQNSYVSMTAQYPAFLPGRIRKLAAGDVTPEIIMVYTGINDVIDNSEEEPFRRDYAKMIENLKKFYPEAQIWCGTLVKSKGPVLYEMVKPETLDNIEYYNNIIRDCVKEGGVNLADLAAQGVAYESINLIHPNAQGMTTFAEAWVKNLKGEI